MSTTADVFRQDIGSGVEAISVGLSGVEKTGAGDQKPEVPFPSAERQAGKRRRRSISEVAFPLKCVDSIYHEMDCERRLRYVVKWR